MDCVLFILFALVISGLITIFRSGLPDKKVEKKVTHKDICVKFVIKDANGSEHRFEAIGFLNEGESSVSGCEMLKRISEKNGGAIGKKDADFLWEYRGQLPEKLHQYYLVTNQDLNGFQLLIECFGWFVCWYTKTSHLSYPWHGHCLVVRRCA